MGRASTLDLGLRFCRRHWFALMGMMFVLDRFVHEYGERSTRWHEEQAYHEACLESVRMRYAEKAKCAEAARTVASWPFMTAVWEILSGHWWVRWALSMANTWYGWLVLGVSAVILVQNSWQLVRWLAQPTGPVRRFVLARRNSDDGLDDPLSAGVPRYPTVVDMAAVLRQRHRPGGTVISELD